MDNFVTIKTFINLKEAERVQRKLEANKIKTLILDELNENPDFDIIKLQVPAYEMELAISILEEAGYPRENLPDIPTFWKKLLTLLAALPLINKFNPIYGFLTLAAVISTIAVVIAYFAIRPTTEELLTNNSWCMEYILFQNVRYNPSTDYKGLNLSFNILGCKETVRFDEKHSVWLPGFKSGNIIGNWRVQDDHLILSSLSAFQYVFERKYLIEEIKGGLLLASDSTVIVMSQPPKASHPLRRDFTKWPNRYGQPHWH